MSAKRNVGRIGAALFIAASTFSAPAQAQRHGGGARVGGAHHSARVGGVHFSGAHVGGHYYRGGYRGHYGFGGGYDNGWGWGGVALDGVLAAQPYYGGDDVGYCTRRFKSYDPVSGTYLGYDGYRHSCP